MKYRSFRIRNFKGIKDATVDMSTMTGANVFALVGLNESGKTTILEAIHSFSPDFRSGRITTTKKESEGSKFQKRVPRHLISTFTGEVSVEATIDLTASDKDNFVEWAQSQYLKNILIDPGSVPDVIIMQRAQ
jgi:AAA15 family ATPase/GTPase